MTARWQEQQPVPAPDHLPAVAAAGDPPGYDPKGYELHAYEPVQLPARAARRRGLLVAAIQATRPRQWPKNLLVFAAPLAGATLGRPGGFGYAVVAFAAFTAAASAVYLLNDVADLARDRQHPVKRLRPIASGRLPKELAVAEAIFCLALAGLACAAIGEPRLGIVVAAYVAISLLYSTSLKHVPGVELTIVAFGFVLRALGGAIATHVPPSGWFLTVCSLGALMVAIGKRYSELAALGDGAAAHRPVMRFYRPAMLRIGLRVVATAMIASYALWALSHHDAWMRGWHLVSIVPLALALTRFDRLTERGTGRPVEDLIARDPVMVFCEVCWLIPFLVGL